MAEIVVPNEMTETITPPLIPSEEYLLASLGLNPFFNISQFHYFHIKRVFKK